MSHFPKDIKKQREKERAGKTHEERQTAALEDIADTVESMRQDLLGLVSALTTILRSKQ